MLRPVADYLRSSLALGLGLGALAGVVAYAANGWPAVAGVAGGAGVMLAATLGAVAQARAVVGGWGARRLRVLASLTGIACMVLALGCFFWLVYYVGAPGWSLAVGVTAVIGGLVCGFIFTTSCRTK
ncbi:MAG: hypothetical protein N2512_09015 [Armatimonadetes bacterium]|nr:hypothetical protein [Armatimonadota bacterium]